MQIKARGRDVLWNYGGLFFRMAGQFFVLPLVLSLLDSEYVGLWYVFTAVSGFIALTPKPDAQASGRLAKMPMQMVMMPAPRQVAQASAPASMPAPESTAGLTAMM